MTYVYHCTSTGRNKFVHPNTGTFGGDNNTSVGSLVYDEPNVNSKAYIGAVLNGNKFHCSLSAWFAFCALKPIANGKWEWEISDSLLRSLNTSPSGAVYVSIFDPILGLVRDVELDMHRSTVLCAYAKYPGRVRTTPPGGTVEGHIRFRPAAQTLYGTVMCVGSDVIQIEVKSEDSEELLRTLRQTETLVYIGGSTLRSGNRTRVYAVDEADQDNFATQGLRGNKSVDGNWYITSHSANHFIAITSSLQSTLSGYKYDWPFPVSYVQEGLVIVAAFEQTIPAMPTPMLLNIRQMPHVTIAKSSVVLLDGNKSIDILARAPDTAFLVLTDDAVFLRAPGLVVSTLIRGTVLESHSHKTGMYFPTARSIACFAKPGSYESLAFIMVPTVWPANSNPVLTNGAGALTVGVTSIGNGLYEQEWTFTGRMLLHALSWSISIENVTVANTRINITLYGKNVLNSAWTTLYTLGDYTVGLTTTSHTVQFRDSLLPYHTGDPLPIGSLSAEHVQQILTSMQYYRVHIRTIDPTMTLNISKVSLQTTPDIHAASFIKPRLLSSAGLTAGMRVIRIKLSKKVQGVEMCPCAVGAFLEIWKVDTPGPIWVDALGTSWTSGSFVNYGKRSLLENCSVSLTSVTLPRDVPLCGRDTTVQSFPYFWCFVRHPCLKPVRSAVFSRLQRTSPSAVLPRWIQESNTLCFLVGVSSAKVSNGNAFIECHGATVVEAEMTDMIQAGMPECCMVSVDNEVLNFVQYGDTQREVVPLEAPDDILSGITATLTVTVQSGKRGRN